MEETLNLTITSGNIYKGIVDIREQKQLLQQKYNEINNNTRLSQQGKNEEKEYAKNEFSKKYNSITKEMKENIEKINSHILHQEYGLSQELKNSVEIIKLLKNNNILTERLLKNEIDKFKGQEMNLIFMREMLKDTITLEAFDKYTFSGYTKGDFDSNPKFIDPTQYFKDMINFVDNYDENLLYYALDGLENRLGLESQERLAHMEEVKKQNEEYQTSLENGILI